MIFPNLAVGIKWDKIESCSVYETMRISRPLCIVVNPVAGSRTLP